MASEWTSSQVDARTFSQMQQRLLDDINRPDLLAQAPSYLQDAMRYFQRKPFFFNDSDNTAVPSYANATIYTAGATIQVTIAGTIYAFVALNQGTSAAVGTPAWPTAPFVPPASPFFPPPIGGTTPGTVVDNSGPNQIIWGNNGPFVQNVTTGFTTLYNVNQYVMPIDLIALNKVEVTWQGNLRIAMTEISYDQLRLYDVVRPAPATYPAWYCWYQQQIYFWPYPVGLFPITLSYRSAPALAKLPTDSNIWTTQAEACIRYYAAGLIQRNLMHDPQAANDCFQLAQIEYDQLVSQGAQQQQNLGVQASDW